jgi:hypothetical protein
MARPLGSRQPENTRNPSRRIPSPEDLSGTMTIAVDTFLAGMPWLDDTHATLTAALRRLAKISDEHPALVTAPREIATLSRQIIKMKPSQEAAPSPLEQILNQATRLRATHTDHPTQS